jgi:hypothetical protein
MHWISIGKENMKKTLFCSVLLAVLLYILHEGLSHTAIVYASVSLELVVIISVTMVYAKTYPQLIAGCFLTLMVYFAINIAASGVYRLVTPGKQPGDLYMAVVIGLIHILAWFAMCAAGATLLWILRREKILQVMLYLILSSLAWFFRDSTPIYLYQADPFLADLVYALSSMGIYLSGRLKAGSAAARRSLDSSVY